jgi:uncharacterized protein YidB (DUF937 family)
MGLLDGLAGQVLGSMLGGKSDKSLLGKIAMEMINKNGGLGGILEKFNQGGLGDLAASWVGTGSNQSLSDDQVSSGFGNDMITEMASKFGVDSSLLTGQIAQYLPELVNQATPAGQVDDKSEDLLGDVLGMLLK